MYEIKGIVGRQNDLGPVAALDARFCVVDLALEPYALLPLDDSAMKAVRELWGLPAPDARPGDTVGVGFFKALTEPVVLATGAQSALAFVEAEFFGGSGQGEALAMRNGEIAVFDAPDDPWPNTNISQALKWIGVPERLDDHQDAFDVVGLGRFRRNGQWRTSFTHS
jgi:hypothetical protein